MTIPVSGPIMTMMTMVATARASRLVRVACCTLAALWGLAGCVLNPDVPPGALISCANDDECPVGFRCQPSDNLCVRGPGFDGAPELSTELLGPGRTVTLSFVASENLPEGGAGAQLVQSVDVVASDAAPATRAMTQTSKDGRAYTFDYVDDPADPSGGWDVVVTLKNAEDLKNDLRAGAIVVDNDLPAVQAGAVIRRIPDTALRGDDVIDVRADTAIEVTFATSEALSTSPAVRAVCGATLVELVRVGDQTSRFVFVYHGDDLGALDDGDCRVEADLTDDAGNVVEAAVVLDPAFVMDQSAPAAPDVDSEGTVLYQRVPWGAIDDGAAPRKRFSIDGLAGSVEPFALVRVYEQADAPEDDAVGDAIADDTGAFALALNPIDRAEVFVSQTDPAGNEGPRARVRDVVWTATLGGKVAGSSFVNPHRMEARAVFSPHLVQASIVERGDEVARADGALGSVSGASSWHDVTTDGGQIDLERAAVSYDPARGKLIAFGGASCRCAANANLAPCPETLERTDVAWHVVTPRDPEGDGDPSRRTGAAMAFDLARGASVLFGGDALGGTSSETWEYASTGGNGTSWRRLCTDAACASSTPPARALHAMAYDPIRRKLVMFGGTASGALLGDTWEWDGATWRLACDANTGCTAPPARAGHQMAYDVAHKRVVMFGGDGLAPVEGSGFSGGAPQGLRNDTWAWDGATWTELCTDAACAAGAPPVRSDFGMAFDDARGRLVVYGGLGPGADDCDAAATNLHERYADTWTFDGASWSAPLVVDPESDGDPGARRLHAMSWDPRRQRVVLLSGVVDEPCFVLECVHPNAEETWEWTGSSWRRFAVVAQPREALSGTTPRPQRAAYDPNKDEVVLVQANGAVDRFREAWRPVGTISSHLEQPALTTSNNGVILEAGRNIDNNTVVASTLLGSGDSFVFRLCIIGNCGSFPDARLGIAGAEDPRGGSVYFGGVDASFDLKPATTFHFDATWTSVTTLPAPDARSQAAMAFDSDRGVTVLFGGQPAFIDPLRDVWEWDGATWTEHTAPGPAGRREAALWYDQARHRTVLFGGDGSGFFGVNCGDGFTTCSDTWEWDGTSWTEPTISDPDDDGEPGPRQNHAAAFHQGLRQAVLFGGTSTPGGAPHSDTWLYDGGGDQRPGMVLFALFAAAGTDGTEQIVDVAARFAATGVGDGGATGTQLLVWDVDRWRALTDSGQSGDEASWSNAATPLDDGGNVTPRLFFGRERTLAFAVTPAAANGGRAGFGALDVDGAEVVVRYRLP